MPDIGFRFSCMTIDGEGQTAFLLGPVDSTEDVALRVLKLAATYYGVLPESIKIVETRALRRSHGFLHPLMTVDDKGVERHIQHWYL